MKINFAALLFILGFLLCAGTAFAASEAPAAALEQDNETPQELNGTVLRESSDIVRQPLSAVPGVDGRVIGQDTPSIVATTEPPATAPTVTTPLPEPKEKAACGPTTLLALAILPLILKRKNQ